MLETKPHFDAGMRCDRCGAPAHLSAKVGSASPLLFCLHHGREYHAALVQAGAVIEVEA